MAADRRRHAGFAVGLLLAAVAGGGVLGILWPVAERFGPAMARLAGEPGLWRAALLALWTGLAGTGLALIATMLLLAVAAERPGRIRVLRRAALPLVAMPHAALGLALVLLLAPSGFLVRAVQQGTGLFPDPPPVSPIGGADGLALIAGIALKEAAFLLIVALPALARTGADRRLATARTLGRAPLAAFLAAVWPLIAREIRLPMRAALVYGISNVDLAAILGPTTPPTLGLLVLRLAGEADPAAHAAAGLAGLLLGGLCAAGIALWSAAGRAAGEMVQRRAWRGRPRRRARAGAALLPAAALVPLLLVAVVLWFALAGPRLPYPALLPPAFDPAALARAAGPALAAAPFTLALALLVAGLAVPVSLLALAPTPSGRPPALALAPLLVPEALLFPGLAILLASAGLVGTLPGLVAAHLALALPYCLIALAEPLGRVDRRLPDAARLLGARHPRLGLLLPMLAGTIALAAAVAVSVSLTQYLSTLVAGAGRFRTLTGEAVALASGGSRATLAALALAQMLLPAAAFALAALVPYAMRRTLGIRPM